MAATATAEGTLPLVGTYLTDGERLVQVVRRYKENPGVRVENVKHPSEEFVISRAKLARWRRVKPDADA